MSFDHKGFLSEDAGTFRTQHRQQYADLFSLIDDLNLYAHRIKFSFNIHKSDIQEVICSCLFLRILNSYAAVVRLAELGMSHDAEALGRVAIEALFHLKQCAESRDATIAYVKSDQQDRLKLLNVAANKSSAMRSLIKEEYFEEIDSLHNLLKRQVEEEKIAERNAWKAATETGLGTVYDYSYRMLSQSVHSSPRSISRYVEVDEEGEVLQVFSAPEKDTIPLSLFAASSTLLTSLMVTSDLFKIEMPELDGLGERFMKLDLEFSRVPTQDNRP